MIEDTQPSIFDNLNDPQAIRRKFQIPRWIRFFCWVFAIICPLGVAAAVIFGIIGASPDIAIYGIKTSVLLSLAGFMGLAIFGIKGAAAIGILLEKDWAIKVAVTDGILGIVMCVYQMIFNPWVTTTTFNNYSETHFNMRLEVLLLIPYLMKMIRIRQQWEENRYAKQAAVTMNANNDL